ncbi:Retrovirus-related Pol polyprotein from transposon TNT 1-94 [Senna tora]|uniref:Retrovirus-related Pol polyprotein from transposon TNT 1-94 n=1 Tax=Senna tora TaxID=362788 RepID=A0A834U1E5_9FABA|nr:Retrovirus-related Pol polyprotein from transposon TNT 1-94 [Senna tora]
MVDTSSNENQSLVKLNDPQKYAFQGSAQPISSKLDDHNFLSWRMLALATIRGHNLYNFLLGGKHIPPKFASTEHQKKDEVSEDYINWECQDQLLLSWMLNSMSDNMVSKMVGCDHSYQLWNKIQESFCSSTRPRERQLRTKLRNTKKGSSTMSEYLLKIKKIVDSLTAIGSPISTHDHIESIFDGLAKSDLDSVSANIAQKSSSQGGRGHNVNHAQNFSFNRGQGFQGFQGRGFYRGGTSNRGGRNSFQNNRGGRSPWSQGSRSQCQVCGKLGHIAINCYNRFNQSFTPTTLSQVLTQNPPRPPNVGQVEALLAIPEILSDDAWFADSGSSNHLTNNPTNLQVSQPYNGEEKVHIANGTVSKNLLSISKFAKDNNVYFTFHADECFVKSQVTHQTLLKGKNKQGLYMFDNFTLAHKNSPTPVFSYAATCLDPIVNSSNPYALWHNRLGHASAPIIKSVLNTCSAPTTIPLPTPPVPLAPTSPNTSHPMQTRSKSGSKSSKDSYDYWFKALSLRFRKF